MLWNAYLNTVKNARVWLAKGTFVEKVGFEPFVPQKIICIVRKACKPQTKDRYRSASEMRDDLEKLVPLIDWRQIDTDKWIGYGLSTKQKHSAEIVVKKNSVSVIIKTNNRTTSNASRLFASADNDKNLLNAREYLNMYISQSMFK